LRALFPHSLVWSPPKNQQTIPENLWGWIFKTHQKSKPSETCGKTQIFWPPKRLFEEFSHESSFGPSKGCCWNLKIPLKGKGDTSTQTHQIAGFKMLAFGGIFIMKRKQNLSLEDNPI